MEILWFIAGVFCGTFVGAATILLCRANKDEQESDRHCDAGVGRFCLGSDCGVRLCVKQGRCSCSSPDTCPIGSAERANEAIDSQRQLSNHGYARDAEVNFVVHPRSGY